MKVDLEKRGWGGGGGGGGGEGEYDPPYQLWSEVKKK